MAKTATLTIDSNKIPPLALAKIEAILYGTEGYPPRLPLPGEIIAIVEGSYLTEDPNDEGTFLIAANAMEPDPNDEGTFIINDNVTEDPDDPGTYISGD